MERGTGAEMGRQWEVNSEAAGQAQVQVECGAGGTNGKVEVSTGWWACRAGGLGDDCFQEVNTSKKVRNSRQPLAWLLLELASQRDTQCPTTHPSARPQPKAHRYHPPADTCRQQRGDSTLCDRAPHGDSRSCQARRSSKAQGTGQDRMLQNMSQRLAERYHRRAHSHRRTPAANSKRLEVRIGQTSSWASSIKCHC